MAALSKASSSGLEVPLFIKSESAGPLADNENVPRIMGGLGGGKDGEKRETTTRH